ncbi:hypothetical protein [Streptosporangium saharense]|uniref:hypothetical protein n=1 Tax=Streptosporangium saharense TaxID=1706840 RepID=UPI0036C79AE7
MALFGGCLPVTVIALINAARLGVSVRGRAIVVCLGLTGVILSVVVAVNLGVEAYHWPSRLIAMVVNIAQVGVQRPYGPDPLLLSRGGDRAPMWVPGAVAVIGGLLFDGVVELWIRA